MSDVLVRLCADCGVVEQSMVLLAEHKQKGHETETLWLKKRQRGKTRKETQWSSDWTVSAPTSSK